MRLFLVRHGNTFNSGEVPYQVGCKTDLDLTDRGREQAKEVGDYFGSLGLVPDVIFAGDLKRQKQTAEIIADTIGYSSSAIKNASGLNEIDYGLWEGKTSEEISSSWAQQQQAWNEANTWAEGIFYGSEEEILEGIKTWVGQLKETYPADATIIAASSGGLIRYFYSLLPSEWRKLRRDRALNQLKIKTGHFSELNIHPREVEVISWNKSPKL